MWQKIQLIKKLFYKNKIFIYFIAIILFAFIFLYIYQEVNNPDKNYYKDESKKADTATTGAPTPPAESTAPIREENSTPAENNSTIDDGDVITTNPPTRAHRERVHFPPKPPKKDSAKH